MVIAYAPGFLASIALPLGFTVADTQRAVEVAQNLLPASLIFGLVGFGLGTYNLIQGLRKRKRYHDLSHRAEEVLFANAGTRAMLAAEGIHPPAPAAGTPIGPVTDDHHSVPHEHAGEHHEHQSPSGAHAAGH
jgi:hypothetical protein